VFPTSLVGTNALVNFNLVDTRSCKAIEIGIGYHSDIDLALSIMIDEVLSHALHIDGRTPEQKESGAPEAIARVVGLGESSITLKVWAWAKDASDGFVLYCDLLKSIKQRFDAEGIEIPFPQRTISYADRATERQ
jgi:small-conductance mechanosensitive channel